MTKYLVLEQGDSITNADCWTVYAENIEASSALSALRSALNGKGDLGSRYVAVPMRSWQPQPIEVETQHRLKIG